MISPAASKQGGVCTATGPDVCKTPAAPSPIPVPYPNIGQLATATGVVNKVLIERKETIVVGSKLPSSSGDEAGSVGGVVSGVNAKDVTFKQGSSKVIAAGKRVVFQAAATGHNGSNANTVGLVGSVANAKVLVSS